MQKSLMFSSLAKRFLAMALILGAMFFASPDLLSDQAHAFNFDDVQMDGGVVSGVGDSGDTDFDGVTSSIKTILQWVTGILALIMFFFLIWQFMKLGASGDNEMARKKSIQGILTSGIALALFGGSSIVIGFFWNALSGASGS